MAIERQVRLGRKAVEAYRVAHVNKTPDEHTPLLNTMLAEFKKQGFNSPQEFFDASELLNIQELSFTSGKEMVEADLVILEGMWQ